MRSCTASCGTSPIFISQMAVGFSLNAAIRTDVSFGVFIIYTRLNPVFHPFALFLAMRSGSAWFTWLKCGNHFALLLQCNHCLEMFLFFLVSQAFTTFFFFFFLPSTSLWGFYSETFIHRYSISLAHAFTRLCMIFVPHMYILHYNYYYYNYNNY